MYISPINMVIDDFQTEVVKEQENYICRAVQKVGVDVDKDELVKALMYDRNQYEKGYEDGLKANKWIPCSERLPEEPKPNKELEGKPLDIYLVCKSGNIPFRAFWNGKFFTDGWTTLDVDAWMPLPTRYESEVE